MQDLKLKLAGMKERLVRAEEEDRAFRRHVTTILTDAFGSGSFVVSSIKDISRKHKNIILVAANKVAAQELFLRRDDLVTAIRKNPLFGDCGLVVK